MFKEQAAAAGITDNSYISSDTKKAGRRKPVQAACVDVLPTLTCALAKSSCFDYLPTVQSESIDLVLIDPPYDISRKSGFKGCKNGVERFAVSMDFGDWDWGFQGLDKVVIDAFRCLRKGGTIIVFYDLWKISVLAKLLEQAGFKQLRYIEWLKTNPVPINSKRNYLTNSREIALLAVKGSKPTFNSKYDNGIYTYPICHEANRFHPTQKPLPLIQDLVRKHSRPNDRVLDCFSGSGTTAVASLLEGRNFTGCELDQTYWSKSHARLRTQFGRNIVITEGDKHA